MSKEWLSSNLQKIPFSSLSALAPFSQAITSNAVRQAPTRLRTRPHSTGRSTARRPAYRDSSGHGARAARAGERGEEKGEKKERAASRGAVPPAGPRVAPHRSTGRRLPEHSEPSLTRGEIRQVFRVRERPSGFPRRGGSAPAGARPSCRPAHCCPAALPPGPLLPALPGAGRAPHPSCSPGRSPSATRACTAPHHSALTGGAEGPHSACSPSQSGASSASAAALGSGLGSRRPAVFISVSVPLLYSFLTTVQSKSSAFFQVLTRWISYCAIQSDIFLKTLFLLGLIQAVTAVQKVWATKSRRCTPQLSQPTPHVKHKAVPVPAFISHRDLAPNPYFTLPCLQFSLSIWSYVPLSRPLNYPTMKILNLF